jgi:WD40 repeat protein
MFQPTGDDRRIRVWDLNTGTLFKELRGHTETVHALSFQFIRFGLFHH